MALRFGGSMTGAGIGAGILYLFGSDRAFTASASASTLLVGLALLVTGYWSRRKNRH